MTNEQAIAHIDSLIEAQKAPVMRDKNSSSYGLIWISENDVTALQMAKDALRGKRNDKRKS